jgi:cobalamin biosynthesis Mg chelatase CobN
VLAVLALACFPGLAVAEENSGIQYETDVPTVPQDEGSNIPSKKNSGGSNTSDENAEATGSNTPGGAGSGGGNGSNTGGTGTGTGQGTQGSGGGGGQRADGSQSAGGDVGSAKSLKTTSSPVESASDDGSSPLVPILIAIVVLAAISIGAFYYRQRRQDPGSTVSPNAN